MGKPGKTPEAKRVLPELKPGKLRRFGYSTHKGAKARHAALGKAARANGWLPTLRRVVAASNYMKRSAPRAHAVMRSDLKWLQENRSRFVET